MSDDTYIKRGAGARTLPSHPPVPPTHPIIATPIAIMGIAIIIIAIQGTITTIITGKTTIVNTIDHIDLNPIRTIVAIVAS